MSRSKNALNTLIAGAFAISLASAAGSSAFAQDGPSAGKEWCYGVVKAGHNDCKAQDGSHGCPGLSKVDGSGADYVEVPAGLCEKLVGGSTEPFKGKGAVEAKKQKEG